MDSPPQLGERALYLYVVNYFELLPGLVILMLPDFLNRFSLSVSNNYTKQVLMIIFLFAIAIAIAILNARAVVINSFLITILLTLFFSKSRLSNFYGYFIYPLILLICLLIIPSRLEYIKRLFSQFLNYFDSFFMSGTYEKIDGSVTERVSNISQSFSEDKAKLINYGFDTVINGSHFWIAQIYYVSGFIGIILFIGLLSLAALKIIKISSKYGKNLNILITAFLIGSFTHSFYYGNFLNSITFFLFLGLILNLELGEKR